MKGWARARKLYLIAAVLAALELVLRLGREQPVLVPSVLGGGGRALTWSVLVPLVWAAVICAIFAGVRSEVEFRPSRRIVGIDAALLVLGTLSFWLLVTNAAPAATKLELLTHCVILAGLATVVTIRWGDGVGIAIVTVVLLVTWSYGPRNPGAAYICFLTPGSDPVLGTGLALLSGTVSVRSLLDRSRSGGQ